MTMANETFCATAWNKSEWHASGAGYGLKLSMADRDRFFRRDWRTVTLRLVAGSDPVDVKVNCAKDSFWSPKCRELISRDLGPRFFDVGLTPWPKGRPPRFHLSPVEPDVFRCNHAAKSV